jgi:plastocyanin domain-containing protein
MRALLAALVLATLPVLGCHKEVEAQPAGKTTIAVTVDDKGFTPSSVDAKQGEPTALAFTRKSNDTCATKVVFPELNVTKDLPLNSTVYVDVPTDKARTLTFQCGMGMFKSSVVVK